MIKHSTAHSLAGLLQDCEVLHHAQQLGLGLLGLLGHVVQEVHPGLVGANICQLVEGGNLHPGSVPSVATLQTGQSSIEIDGRNPDLARDLC